MASSLSKGFNKNEPQKQPTLRKQPEPIEETEDSEDSDDTESDQSIQSLVKRTKSNIDQNRPQRNN